MPDQRSLFADEPKPRKTRAPEELDEKQRLRLAEWAAKRVPWVLTGNLDCFDTLETFEEACLNWYRSKGRMGVDWVGAIEGWIWRDEKPRVARMARNGNDSAKLALRDPEKWRRDLNRAKRMAPDMFAEADVIIPKGSNVVSLLGRMPK
jgi:hypothetical protein